MSPRFAPNKREDERSAEMDPCLCFRALRVTFLERPDKYRARKAVLLVYF